MKRKLVLVFLLFSFLLIVLCGCGSVTFNNILSTDGSITQQFVIEVDSESDLDILDSVEIMFRQMNYSVKRNVDTPNILKASRYFSSYTDYYIFYGITGDEENENEGDIVKGFWFDKYVTVTSTVFADLADENFVKPYHDIYFKNYDFNRIKDVEFIYTYGTKYATVYGEDADFTSENNGVYLYTWYLDYDNITKNITLVQIAPNSAVWYTIAIVGSIVLILIFVIITKVLLKKKNTKEKLNGGRTD